MPPRYRVRDAIRIVEKDGWYLVKFTGSHRQFNHPTKSGRVTIPGHPGSVMHPGLWNSIMKQAGLK